MFNLVEHPFIQECFSRRAGGLGGRAGSFRIPRRRGVQFVFCHSPASASFRPTIQSVSEKDVQRPPSPLEQTKRIGRRERSSQTIRAASLSAPFPEAHNGGAPPKAQNGAANRFPVEASAKGKWRKNHESSLSEDEPLPLPMTWPNSEPDPKEKIQEMLNCDPEAQTCKDVVYQWTGECQTCQGTGLVSFYRKRHEVISKCINCLGIGSVHKITSRADIQGMDGMNGSSNGSVRSNGKA